MLIIGEKVGQKFLKIFIISTIDGYLYKSSQRTVTLLNMMLINPKIVSCLKAVDKRMHPNKPTSKFFAPLSI